LLTNKTIKEKIQMLNKYDDFYSLILTSKGIKYYTTNWTSDIYLINKILKILLELVDNIENILKKDRLFRKNPNHIKKK
jgi:hypothetical protein